MKNIWKKLKCAEKEIFNFLTNTLTPIISLLCVLAEILQLPTKVIQTLKNAEYWCWQAGGTKKNIDNFISEVDKVLQIEEEVDSLIKEDEE